MCSVSLIAIELKGLAAPGEALKNKKWKHMWKIAACLSLAQFLAVGRHKLQDERTQQ